MWIFGRSYLDILFLVVPGYIALVLTFVFGNGSPAYVIIASFLIWTLIDSGHVYTTIWRTYAHPAELKSNREYFYMPFVIIFSVACWLYFRIPYFWSFIVYYTLYHNIRQFYGITKWYQKLEGAKSPWPGRFVYILTLLAFLSFTFREIDITMYTPHDFLMFPNLLLFQISQGAFFICFVIWLLYEVFTFKTSRRIGRFFSILTPALCYGVGLIWGHNELQILGGIIAAHGIGYWGLISIAANKTRPSYFKNLWIALLIIILTAVSFGLLEGRVEEYTLAIFTYTSQPKLNFIACLAVGASLTPLLLHFYFDAKIWTHKHREANLIFS